MNAIDLNDTIFTITEKYPETVDVFVSRGFPRMAEYEQRAGYGKLLTLKMALEMKNLNPELFIGLLNEAVSRRREGIDATLAGSERSTTGSSISVTGLLPCPVRIPLIEEFKGFSDEYQKTCGVSIDAELKAASSGTEWVEEHISGATEIDSLPDLFISAGFDLFFDEKQIGRFRRQKEFIDLVDWKERNPTFADLDLKDPQGEYSIIAAVPAVFLVNRGELGDRAVPESWQDLLRPEYENSVSLPVGDFDLFNAILLSISTRYGREGVEALGRSMLTAMHPSQMVRSDRLRTNRPAITIMPYFFTKTVRNGGPLEAVWPADGAVLSPIFMLAKKNRREMLKPVAEFFASRKIGEILAHQGLFPSLHPRVDNRIPETNSFMWIGWDYIRSHDLSAEIAACEAVFETSVEKSREFA